MFGEVEHVLHRGFFGFRLTGKRGGNNTLNVAHKQEINDCQCRVIGLSSTESSSEVSLLLQR